MLWGGGGAGAGAWTAVSTLETETGGGCSGSSLGNLLSSGDVSSGLYVSRSYSQ